MDDIFYPERTRDVEYLSHNSGHGVAHDDSPPGRGSGRYAWGSGKRPFQHGGYEYRFMDGPSDQSFVDFVKMMREGYTDSNGDHHDGVSDSDIAISLGFTKVEYGIEKPDIKALHNRLAYSNESRKNDNRRRVMQVMEEHPEYQNEDGNWSATKIARALGMNDSQESTVRGWIDSIDEENNFKIRNTADCLKDVLNEVTMVPVGKGASEVLGVTSTKLDAAVQLLCDEEGYNVYKLEIPQPSDPLKKTNVMALCPPGMTYAECQNRKAEMRPIVGYNSEDDGMTFTEYGLRTPASVGHNRVEVRFGKEGSDRDGLIELRSGLDELSLCGKVCAQVRIAVDGTHYIKGMAVENPDLPKGVDIRFNTSKSPNLPILGPDKDHTVLKLLKDDPNNPFGSMLKTKDGEVVGQRDYIDPKTGEKKLSPINVCREEGDWEDWSRSLPSQMWSKQSTELAKRQLGWSIDEKRAEFEDIKKLTNPEIRQALFNEFSEKCDTAAVDLKAAKMPRQTTNVILPCPTLKPNQIYAPMYDHGEEVICIRYPHGGLFEIAHLTVNNKNKEGRNIIGTTPSDAVGLPPIAAQQLSGADYDGDTVTVIPMRGNENIIRYKPMLEAMKGFATSQYEKSDDQVPTGPKKKGGDGFNTQKEMGVITNLIMDMTQAAAPDDELCRAVKHSMVVIDAEKHNLDHKASYKENNIEELKKKYQPKPDAESGKKYGGAGTLITRAKSETHIPHRREVYSRSQMTPEEQERYDRGERIFRESGKMKNKYDKKTGKWIKVEAMETSNKMRDTNDAYTLITGEGTDMEKLGAEYANTMKAMANEARREARNVTKTKVNQQAKEVYAKEIEELRADLVRAKTNKQYEQVAQTVAYGTFQQLKRDNPTKFEDKDYSKKVRNQTLTEQRRRFNASKKKVYVRLNERKIEAMNSGAISSSMITEIINNCDKDQFKKLAMPKADNGLSTSEQMQIKHLVEMSKGKENGYTSAEIAQIVGCSMSSVNKYK